jgi:hypothetical protein
MMIQEYIVVLELITAAVALEWLTMTAVQVFSIACKLNAPRLPSELLGLLLTLRDGHLPTQVLGTTAVPDAFSDYACRMGTQIAQLH